MLEQSYHVATLDHDAERIFGESYAFIARLAPRRAGRPARVGWTRRKGRQPVAEQDADRGDSEEKGVPVGEPLDGARGEGLGERHADPAAGPLGEPPGDARTEARARARARTGIRHRGGRAARRGRRLAAIVRGYGEEPPDPPGARPFKPVEDLALPDPVPDGGPEEDGSSSGRRDAEGGDDADGKPAPDAAEEGPASVRPLGGSIAFAPGVGAGAGPRDHTVAEPSDGDSTRTTRATSCRRSRRRCRRRTPPPSSPGSRVLGGPVLLLLAVLFGWDMTWWITTLGIGGFLGGFATLVARMQDATRTRTIRAAARSSDARTGPVPAPGRRRAGPRQPRAAGTRRAARTGRWSVAAPQVGVVDAGQPGGHPAAEHLDARRGEDRVDALMRVARRRGVLAAPRARRPSRPGGCRGEPPEGPARRAAR